MTHQLTENVRQASKSLIANWTWATPFGYSIYLNITGIGENSVLKGKMAAPQRGIFGNLGSSCDAATVEALAIGNTVELRFPSGAGYDLRLQGGKLVGHYFNSRGYKTPAVFTK